MYRILSLAALLLLTTAYTAKAQDVGNLGLEEGSTSGWERQWGYFRQTAGDLFHTNCDNVEAEDVYCTTGVDCSVCMHSDVSRLCDDTEESRFKAMSRGFDPFVTTEISGVHIPVLRTVSKEGGNHSLRLGFANPVGFHSSDGPGQRLDRVSYAFDVSESLSMLSYQYAIVMDDALHCPVVQPRFTAYLEIYDPVNSIWNELSCSRYEVIAKKGASCFVESSSLPFVSEAALIYKDWETVSVDLSGHVGEQARLVFEISGCAAGAHRGYAYVDVLTEENNGEITSRSVGKSPSSFKYGVDFYGPEGFGSYLWMDASSEPLSHVSLKEGSANGFHGMPYWVKVTNSKPCSEKDPGSLPTCETTICTVVEELGKGFRSSHMYCGDGIDVHTGLGESDLSNIGTPEGDPILYFFDVTLESPIHPVTGNTIELAIVDDGSYITNNGVANFVNEELVLNITSDGAGQFTGSDYHHLGDWKLTITDASTNCESVFTYTVYGAELSPEALGTNYQNLEVLSASASKFSDAWPIDFKGLEHNPKDLNPYANGTSGVWRSESSFAYLAERNGIDPNGSTPVHEQLADLQNFGTFQLNTFDWEGANRYMTTPDWVKVSTITEYGPQNNELENRDALERPSAALFGYKGQLPTMVAAHAGMGEMGFASFEDDSHGNMQWGLDNSEVQERYHIGGGRGNLVLVHFPGQEGLSMTELEGKVNTELRSGKAWNLIVRHLSGGGSQTFQQVTVGCWWSLNDGSTAYHVPDNAAGTAIANKEVNEEEGGSKTYLLVELIGEGLEDLPPYHGTLYLNPPSYREPDYLLDQTGTPVQLSEESLQSQGSGYALDHYFYPVTQFITNPNNTVEVVNWDGSSDPSSKLDLSSIEEADGFLPTIGSGSETFPSWNTENGGYDDSYLHNPFFSNYPERKKFLKFQLGTGNNRPDIREFGVRFDGYGRFIGSSERDAHFVKAEGIPFYQSFKMKVGDQLVLDIPSADLDGLEHYFNFENLVNSRDVASNCSDHILEVLDATLNGGGGVKGRKENPSGQDHIINLTSSSELDFGTAYSPHTTTDINNDEVRRFLISATSIVAPESYSLSVWFKTTTPGGKLIGFQSEPCPTSDCGTWRGRYDRMIYMGTDGHLFFGSFGAGNDRRHLIGTSGTYADGEWHHAMGTYDHASGVLAFYVDGQKVEGGYLENPEPFRDIDRYHGHWIVGAGKTAGWKGSPAVNNGPGHFFQGNIDEVMVFDRAIRELAVGSIYERMGNAGIDVVSKPVYLQNGWHKVAIDIRERIPWGRDNATDAAQSWPSILTCSSSSVNCNTHLPFDRQEDFQLSIELEKDRREYAKGEEIGVEFTFVDKDDQSGGSKSFQSVEVLLSDGNTATADISLGSIDDSEFPPGDVFPKRLTKRFPLTGVVGNYYLYAKVKGGSHDKQISPNIRINVMDNEKVHTGRRSLVVTTDQASSEAYEQGKLRLVPGREYVLSGWMALDDASDWKDHWIPSDMGIRVLGPTDTELGPLAVPKGTNIEGWRRFETKFTAPDGEISLQLLKGAPSKAYFDDIRIFPSEGNAQTYVYEPDTYRLRAVLDNNNYATLYYYDDEGSLYLLMKETANGVMTVQESKSHTVPTTQDTSNPNFDPFNE